MSYNIILNRGEIESQIKKFLTDFSGMDDYPIPSVTVWEHYLVYAPVLGVADKVMDQLKVKLPAEEITRTRSSFLYSG